MGLIIPNIQNTSRNQLDLFRSNLSKKPYCSNDLTFGLQIRSASEAISRKYIQPNHPNSKLWLLFDIDRPIGLESIEDLNLPTPTFFVQNKVNHHAHLYYGLHTAVHMNANSSQKAQRFAGAVDSSLCRALDGDAGYVGLVAKNPLHNHWRTYNTNQAYDLEDFSEYIDLQPFNDRRKAIEAIGLGRNVALFDTLRRWAYKAIRQGWPAFDQWHKASFDRAFGINAGFSAPLPLSEVKATAKSVAKYVHTKYSPKSFSERQSHLGKLSGQKRLSLSADKREQARDMLDSGVSKAEIARLLKVSDRTIRNWLN